MLFQRTHQTLVSEVEIINTNMGQLRVWG